MANEQGKQTTQFAISYFDGCNSSVSGPLSKRTELSHAENARSPIIGVLEKREGQIEVGTNLTGGTFSANENWGIFRFPTTDSTQQGLFRITSSDSLNSPSSSPSNSPSASLSTSTSPSISTSPSGSDSPSTSASASPSVSTSPSNSPSTSRSTSPSTSLSTSPSPSLSTSISFSPSTSPSAGAGVADIYSLSTTNKWTKLAATEAQNISEGQFDYTIADKNLILVNKNDYNRMIYRDGQTVISSESPGSLYNSPRSSKVCYYKNRIHMADFITNGVTYPTTVVRSSYPLGIVALVNGDHSIGTTTLEVTDNKYFYADSGMNRYDIYRGSTFIETITVTAVNETSVTTATTSNTILSSDEIWIEGTYRGEKQYRWVSNPTASGKDVKQYDTFRLSGGEDDSITLFDTIGNVMVIGNHYSLSTWDDYTLTTMDMGIGCSSPVGSVKLLGTLFFIHYSGIFGTTGGVPTLLSRKVSRYITGATKAGLESAATGVKGMSVFFAIGDSTLYKEDGSVEKVLRDVCLEYSIADQNWYVHTNVPIAEFATFISSDGSEKLMGLSTATHKHVVSFLEGDTDLGQEIFMRVDTQDIQFFKEFENFAQPINIVTEVKRGSQIKCFISPDGEDWYGLEGTVTKGVSNLKITSRDGAKTQPILCRKIKISFRDSSKQRCRLSQLAIYYKSSLVEEVKE